MTKAKRLWIVGEFHHRLEVIGDIHKLRLRPDDLIVIECPGEISPEVAERLRDLVGNEFPNHRAVVVGDGVKMRAELAPEDEP